MTHSLAHQLLPLHELKDALSKVPEISFVLIEPAVDILLSQLPLHSREFFESSSESLLFCYLEYAFVQFGELDKGSPVAQKPYDQSPVRCFWAKLLIVIDRIAVGFQLT